MDDPDPSEPATHVLTGTVMNWRGSHSELLTGSGVTVPLVARDCPPGSEGTLVRFVARKPHTGKSRHWRVFGLVRIRNDVA